MTQNIEKITKKLGITLNNMQQTAQQTLLEEKENVIICLQQALEKRCLITSTHTITRQNVR